MSVGYDGMRYLPPWINVEIASRTIETIGINFE
jgi:hypothetical protein